ncbi:MAG: dihydropteroate synthase [Gemmatimonadales bacterium]
MIVIVLSDRGDAIRHALLSHGWEGDLAAVSAEGSARCAFHVTGIDAQAVEAMVPVAARFGLDLVTGGDWLIVAGARSRIGAMARPGALPAAFHSLAAAIGGAIPGERPRRLRHARGVLALNRPVIVGIMNLTPDSFSDGGTLLSVDAALRRADDLQTDGAAVIDLGGESTRPGAKPVRTDVECGRVVPVIEAIAKRFPALPLSIDTVHAVTADAALGAGAAIINDVTAGRHDPGILAVAARTGAALVLMHSRGELGSLASYQAADYGGDVAGAVTLELRDALGAAIGAGMAEDAVAVDPGFGFGKTVPQCFQLLDQLDAVAGLGRPVMVGVSRKRFLGEAAGRPVEDRDRATAAACAVACERGAALFRVHAPAAVRDALALVSALAEAAV